MNPRQHRNKPGKNLPAILAALGMTGLIAIVILAIAANALGTQVGTAQAAAPDTTQIDLENASKEDLQALVLKYQEREAQYQDELNQAADQLANSQNQVQQLEMILGALQNAGVIRITPDGRIAITRQARGDDFFGDGN